MTRARTWTLAAAASVPALLLASCGRSDPRPVAAESTVPPAEMHSTGLYASRVAEHGQMFVNAYEAHENCEPAIECLPLAAQMDRVFAMTRGALELRNGIGVVTSLTPPEIAPLVERTHEAAQAVALAQQAVAECLNKWRTLDKCGTEYNEAFASIDSLRSTLNAWQPYGVAFD